MGTALTVIAKATPTGSKALAARQAAQEAAAEHVHALLDSAGVTRALALEVAAGGDLYPAGIRAQAEQLAKALSAAADTIVTVGNR